MINSNHFAEMVNQANFTEMSYRELLETKNACLWGIEHRIDPLLETKRHEELVSLSAFYLDSIRIFNATRAEIISCLEEANVRENIVFAPSQDVDDQTPTVDVDDNQDKGKSVLALPESFQTTEVEDAEATPVEASDTEKQNHDEDMDSGNVGDTSNEENVTIQEDSAAVDVSTDLNTSSKPILVEAVVEIAKNGRIPDNIDVNAPYFVIYTICHDADGKLWRNGNNGRNLDAKDLESFRAANKQHQELFRKKEVMMSTDDCLVFRKDERTIEVVFYHFPEHDVDDVYHQALRGASYSNNIPYYATVDLHKTHRRMRKAIEKAKEYSASIGSSTSPYYDKYIFYDNNASVELNSNPERVIEDEETLIKTKSNFETFARLHSAGTVLISDDNCVAAKTGSKIYVALFNFPHKEKEIAPAKRKRRKVIKETESNIKVTPTLNEDPLISKAVEMTMSLPTGNGIDVNAPYFVQCDLSVIGDGELIQKGKPFIKNVSGEEEFAKLRRNHLRFAKTMKANDPVSTDDYTAYFWNDGKNISVFYYNTKGLAISAA